MVLMIHTVLRSGLRKSPTSACNKPHVRVRNVLIPSYSTSHVVTSRYDDVFLFHFTQLETSPLPVKAANVDILYLALVAIEQSTLFIVPIM